MLNHAVHSYASVYVGVISAFMKVVRLTLAEELEKQRASFGEEQSPVSTVARTFVCFVCLLLLGTRKVACRF